MQIAGTLSPQRQMGPYEAKLIAEKLARDKRPGFARAASGRSIARPTETIRSSPVVIDIIDTNSNDTRVPVATIRTDAVIIGEDSVAPAAVSYDPLSGEPRIAGILQVVARSYGMSMTDLLAQRRTRSLVRARHIAMHLAKTLTTKSLPEIGRRFGGLDHTTILHGVRKIEGLLDKDPELSERIEALKTQIMGTGIYVAHQDGLAGRAIAAAGEALGG